MYPGPIHRRSITINTFEESDDVLVLDGTLIDDRLCKTFIYLLSKIVDSGTIHHINLRLELLLPDLIINSAVINMMEVPHAMCRDIQNSGDKLRGISIFKGFNKKITELIGGKNGCLHLFNLLLSMRAAAFQGYFTYVSRVLEDGSIRFVDIDRSAFLNTCHMWSESGPFAALLKSNKNTPQLRE